MSFFSRILDFFRSKAPEAPKVPQATIGVQSTVPSVVVAPPVVDHSHAPFTQAPSVPYVPAAPVVVAPVVTAPSLDYDGRTFSSQAELDDYKRRVNERNTNLQQWQNNQVAQDQELQPGQWDIRHATIEDLQFLFQHPGELQERVGPGSVVHQAMNWLDGQGPKPDSIPGLPDSPPRPFDLDASKYQGPLLALV